MALISIIVPVANRVNRLVLQCKQVEKIAAESQKDDFEFIFVDDGSHLEPNSRIERLAKEDKRFRLVILTRNFGPTAAFLAGMSYASGDCAAFFPTTRFDPSRVFSQLVQQWRSGNRVVLGKWEHPTRPTRSGKGVFWSDPLLKQRIFSNRIYFQDISSLIVDKEVIHILSQISDPFSDVVELLAWIGIGPQLVEYSQELLPDGEPKMRFKARIISLNYAEGIFTQSAFRASMWVGFLLGAVGVLITAGLILASELYQYPLPDWWMFAGAICFILGMQLILMGIFGEQVYKSLEKIRSRPAYVVDSVINPPVSASEPGKEKVEKMLLSLWNIRKHKVPYGSSVSSQKSAED